MASEEQSTGAGQPATQGTGQEAPSSAFPPFDSATYPSTILWLFITFGLLYLMMSRYALPRVGSILKTRSRHIGDDLAAANKMRNEAKAAATAYDRMLGEARARAQALAAQTRDMVKLEQDKNRAELELQLNGKLASAEHSIAETKATAMGNVGQIASETAGAIVQHFTGAPADPDALAAALATARA